jgi:hypothetical protein
VQIYFASQKWWSPPGAEANPVREGEDDDEAGEWDSGLPDVTD